MRWRASRPQLKRDPLGSAPSMAQQLGHLLAPVLTLLYCLDFAVGELRLMLNGLRTRNWPSVDATVLHCDVRTGGFGRSSTSYPSVIYRYAVGGTDYHGNHLGYRGWAWRDMSRTAGDHVRVWYDPTHPSSSVLRAGAGFVNYFGTALGLTAIALATSWLVWSVRAA